MLLVAIIFVFFAWCIREKCYKAVIYACRRSFVIVFVIEPAVSRFIDTMGRIINWLNLNKNFL